MVTIGIVSKEPTKGTIYIVEEHSLLLKNSKSLVSENKYIEHQPN